MKLVESEVGPMHVASDIGCHTYTTLTPFHIGNSVLGYGQSHASAQGIGPLFGTRVISSTEFRNHYVPTSDGQRFLINSTLEETSGTPITVVVNWTADLKR